MIKTTFKEYQQEALDIPMRRHIYAIDPGGGKTLLALGKIDQLKQRHGKILSVVLCPKTATEVTWGDQITKHTNFSYSIDYFDPNVDINIFSLSKIDRAKHIFNSLKPEHDAILIIDEAQCLCSEDSERAFNLRGGEKESEDGARIKYKGMIEQFKYVYFLTATPMINHIENLYFLVDSLFPGFFPTQEWFMERYSIRRLISVPQWRNGKKTYRKVKEVVGYKNLEDLRERLKPIMFRYVVDYPLKFHFHECILNEEEMRGYRELGAGYVFNSERPKDYMARLPELQRFVNGSITADRRSNHDPLLSTKEQHLLNLLKEVVSRGEGALVFTECLETMRRFELIGARLSGRAFYMSGKTAQSRREFIKREVSPGDVCFCTGVAGVSLNFQAVNNVFLYDMDWSVGDVQQYIGRITRIDSTYLDMNVHIPIAKDTIDQYKVALFNTNMNLAKQILGGWGFLDVYFKKIERQQVMALKKSLLWGQK